MADKLEVGSKVYFLASRALNVVARMGHRREITSETDDEWVLDGGSRKHLIWPKGDRGLYLFDGDAVAMRRIGALVQRLYHVEPRKLRGVIDGVAAHLEKAVEIAEEESRDLQAGD